MSATLKAPNNTRSSRIADILHNIRRQAFIGREMEIEFFQSMVLSPQPDKILLFLHGAGGQGKTSLLRHFTEWCAEENIPAIHLDGRELQAHPAAMLEYIRTSVHAKQAEEISDKLANMGEKIVLFIDTYEKLSPLDNWFRTDFLPQLPLNVRVVISSRKAPSLSWQTDAGWKSLMMTMPLRNLTMEESRLFLSSRQVPDNQHQAILDFTYGHPLALSLVADTLAHQRDKVFSLAESPDMVQALLETFLQQIPGPAHRVALHITAFVHHTTESILAEIMELESASAIFEWLQELSFMDKSREGLFPHDVIREALVADLRWRHPDFHFELYEKIKKYYASKMGSNNPVEQRKTLFELIYLHRSHPMVRPFFDWQEAGSQWVDTMATADIPAIRAMVQKNEGEEALALFDFWKAHPAAQVWVWRDTNKRPEAFVLKINAHELDRQELTPDKIVNDIWHHRYQDYQLRSGEQVVLFRSWMADKSYQGVSPLQSSMFLAIIQYYFTPCLAISMVACAQPDFWEQVFHYGGIYRDKAMDFESSQKTYGWFTHDWRKQPLAEWLDMLGKRGLGGPLEEPMNNKESEVMVLSEEAFQHAVTEALRHYHYRDELMHNPLTQSQVVCRLLEVNASTAERVETLQHLLNDAIARIEQSPIDNKYYRVLYRSYINPVGSQEKTADFLNMSFSTYRRYLKAGTDRVSELLWQQEVLK
ncbi:MAG TPA: hypothetical protein PKA00_07605 [Saprospiraceae bacterium]|nr:hypothetical protein [Saprospiraceae bacterium]HMQ82756.1 hypothetical protein [Saprospiraceae bacterium]